MLVGVLAEHRLDDARNRMSVGSIVFAELLLSPFACLVGLHSEPVHPVYDPRHVAVTASLLVGDALTIHQLPCRGTRLRACRSLAFLLRLTLMALYLHHLGERPIDDTRVACQSRQTVDVAALRVVVNARQVLQQFVGGDPCVVEVLLRHLALHLHNSSQPLSGYGSVGEPHVFTILHRLLHHLHPFRRDVVEIDHHEWHEANDVVGSLPVFHYRLRHDGRQLLFETGELRLQVSLSILVAVVLSQMIERQKVAVFATEFLELCGTDHLRHMFPRHALRLRVGEGRKKGNLVCHISLIDNRNLAANIQKKNENKKRPSNVHRC